VFGDAKVDEAKEAVMNNVRVKTVKTFQVGFECDLDFIMCLLAVEKLYPFYLLSKTVNAKE
jgi:hypothetical protein